jgi:O-antigen/teichoic acid export membrane protein
MTLFGVVGATLLAGLAPWLVESALRISPEVQGEAETSFYLLAFSLPWVFLTIGLRGVLEAKQSFGLVNALRVPMGLFNYLGPMAVLPFSGNLVPVIATLVAGRIAACVAHFVVCLRTFPLLRNHFRVDRAYLKPLMRIGGWMTVSNIVSPLMTYVDRFFIGASISMAAVMYYVTPYEMITKFWLVPSALMGVLFPAFAATYARDQARTRQLFDRGVRAVFLTMFPATLVVVTLAPEGLALWLGTDFAASSTRVLQWLAVGVFLNSLGNVPFSMLHAIGRPDLTGKLHLAELPVYLLAIWWLSRAYGIEGVAMAWALRVAIDSVVLFLATKHFLPETAPDLRRMASLVAVAMGILALAAAESGPVLKVTLLTAVLASFGVFGWFRLLDPSERALVRG